MSEQTGDCLFLTGAEMDPTRVRHEYPDARFVARGYTEVHRGEVSSQFGEVVTGPGVGDVWGIVLGVDSAIAGNPRRHSITTDDKRTFTAVCPGDRMLDGFAAEVLAAAQYWELPPGYVGRLKMATPKIGSGNPDDE